MDELVGSGLVEEVKEVGHAEGSGLIVVANRCLKYWESSWW